jgi:DNA-binding NtrC family response regulator
MSPDELQPRPETPGKVLLIDDEPMATRTLLGVIELEPSFEAVAFNSPDDALAHLADHPMEVIVSDFIMPGKSGLDVLMEARRLQPETSRILLTGYADKASAIESINKIGLFQYIEKPWDNASLLLVLRNAIERTRLLRHVRNGATQEDLRERLWRMLV